MPTIGTVDRIDFEIRDNKTFKVEFVVKNHLDQIEDVTNWIAKIQFRDRKGGALLATFGIGSGIAVDGPNGIFELKIQPADIQSWTFRSGWYDVLLTDVDLDKYCESEGTFKVVKGATY